MQFHDLETFNENWLIKTRQEWLCYGNIIPHCSLELAKAGEKLLRDAREGRTLILPREEVPNIQYFKIPVKKHMVLKKDLKNTPSFTPNNSGITMSFC